METPLVIQKILAHENAELARMTGFSEKFFWSVKKRWRHVHFRMYKNTLDELYRVFKLKRDAYYYRTIKKTENSSDFVLGALLKSRRRRLSLSVEQVAEKLKGTELEIKRIEHGDVLPYECGYYITQLLDLYEFEQEEKDRILWHIILLKEMRDHVKVEEKKLAELEEAENDMER